MIKHILAAAAALAFASPIAAGAQTVPSYASNAPAEEQVQGRITAFDGAYSLTVNDDNGYVDNVSLHDGTVINPTGLTLAPGMIVSILGYNDGPTFAANEIDTPYTSYDGGWYYAGHPWFYYGPTVSFGFFFGGSPWWHGRGFAAYHGFEGGYSRGVAYRNDVRVDNTRIENTRIDNARIVTHQAVPAYTGYQNVSRGGSDIHPIVRAPIGNDRAPSQTFHAAAVSNLAPSGGGGRDQGQRSAPSRGRR